MSSTDPQRRYLVVPNRNEAKMTIQSTMNRIVQLNSQHAYKFTKEELLEMMEQTIDAAGE